MSDADNVLRLRRQVGDPPLSDDAIARACGAGDPSAVGELFDRFHRPVAGYIARLIGRTSDVEDLVQSTFLQIARGKTVYDGRASVKTWIFAIATNVVRHHRRTYARRFRLHSAVASQDRPLSVVPAPPDDHANARRQLQRARAALASLSDDQREAFVLCDLEGLSAREAGEILGLSEAAVWKRASRARAKVRRALGVEVKP